MPTRDTVKRGASRARDFGEGVRLYWRGVAMWGKDPRLMLLGLIPGVITWTLFLGLFASMWWWLDDTTRWIATRVAGDSGIASLLAVVLALAIVAGSLLLVVYAFVSITSVVGQWFFEKISHRVDDRLGPVAPGPEWPWWRNARRGIGEGLRLFAFQAPLSLAVFLTGLIPVIGTPLAWVGGALIGGWFVALELTSVPFERRGLVLADRRRLLGQRRAMTVGFGAMAFIMSILPPVAVLSMPGGVAAGTVLARRVLDEHATTSTP